MEQQKCFNGHTFDVSEPVCPYCPSIGISFKKDKPLDISNINQTKSGKDMPPTTIRETPLTRRGTAQVPVGPEQPKPFQAQIRILTNGNAGPPKKLNRPTVYIGNQESNLIFISDPDLMPAHAVITIDRKNKTIKIIDQAKIGFLIINGEKKENVKEWTLNHKDQVTMGQTIFEIEIV